MKGRPRGFRRRPISVSFGLIRIMVFHIEIRLQNRSKYLGSGGSRHMTREKHMFQSLTLKQKALLALEETKKAGSLV